MSATLIPAASLQAAPWRNGGGVTREIAAHPAGAGLDSFDWRISMADVDRDGSFSAFPGVERSLCVLSGRGIDLDIGHATIRVETRSDPVRFPADEDVFARLLKGSIRDLNVMTRRGRFEHRVSRIHLAAQAVLPGAAYLRFVVVESGALDLSGGRQALAGDSAMVEGGGDGDLIRSTARTRVIVVDIDPDPIGCLPTYPGS